VIPYLDVARITDPPDPSRAPVAIVHPTQWVRWVVVDEPPPWPCASLRPRASRAPVGPALYWPPSRADVGPLVPILALWGLL